MNLGIILIFLITITNFSLISYSNANTSNILEPDKERQSKAYPAGIAAAQAYYDAALKGELQTSEKKPFLFSSLKLVKSKPSGISEGGIYKDANGGIWIVKYAQDPIREYLGAKIMDLLIGPFSPEVKVLIDAPGYTASKLLPGFLMQQDVLADPGHKPIIGEEKLLIAMDLMGLGDRSAGNLGYIDLGNKLVAARVDFDASFYFRRTLDPLKYNNLKALKSIVSIPDEMFFYVLGEAYKDLWEAGIPINYESYNDLGSQLIERKNLLGNYLEFLTLYNKAKSNPSLFTSEDSKRLSQIISIANDRPLHWAVINNETKLVSLLLDNGADVNAKDEKDNTPLLLAADNGHLEVISLLLDNGADVNAKDERGNTPLMLAALRDNQEVVSLLLNNGADVNAKNYWGTTPLDILERNSMLELLNPDLKIEVHQ